MQKMYQRLKKEKISQGILIVHWQQQHTVYMLPELNLSGTTD